MVSRFVPVAQPIISAGDRRAVNRVLKSGLLAQGRKVAEFETEFSRLVVESRACVALNSGTSALHLGLIACGVGPGDEVIVPSFTFSASANSIALTGATPVFVDISLEDFCIDPMSIENALSERTVGVMAVHMFGHPARMDVISKIAEKAKIAVFEDASQAHLATVDGKRVGTFGTFAAFSFYPTKNMTSGEGGMFVCSDPALERRVRLLRNQGMEAKYQNEVVGFNNRMTEVHAALGLSQLERLQHWTQARKRNAAYLSKNLPAQLIPRVREGYSHSFHQYTLTIPRDRNRLQTILRDTYQIGSDVYYPFPLHDLQSLKNFPRVGELKNAEQAAASVLSIPISPNLSRSTLRRIAAAVNASVRVLG